MARILLATLLAAAAATITAQPASACHPPPASLGCPHPGCPPLCIDPFIPGR